MERGSLAGGSTAYRRATAKEEGIMDVLRSTEVERTSTQKDQGYPWRELGVS
jgi:hypothetical protein